MHAGQWKHQCAIVIRRGREREEEEEEERDPISVYAGTHVYDHNDNIDNNYMQLYFNYKLSSCIDIVLKKELEIN